MAGQRGVHAICLSRGSDEVVLVARRTRSAPKWQENVLPRPTSLSISSRAWCRFSTCLTIDRPSPVPPLSRERLVETR